MEWFWFVFGVFRISEILRFLERLLLGNLYFLMMLFIGHFFGFIIGTLKSRLAEILGFIIIFLVQL